jgi:hypothetical protein
MGNDASTLGDTDRFKEMIMMMAPQQGVQGGQALNQGSSR